MKLFLKIAVFLLFLGPGLNVFGQFSIGPKLGLTLARAGGENVDSASVKTLAGMQLGAATQFRFSEKIGIQTELLYYQKGIRNKYEFYGEIYQSKLTLNYIEIPVLAKFMFFAQEDAQVFVTAGPSFGFGWNGKLKIDDLKEYVSFNENNLKKFDLSLSVGAGVQLPVVRPGKMFLDVRYLLGFTSISEIEDVDVKNRGIGVGLGYIYPLGS